MNDAERLQEINKLLNNVRNAQGTALEKMIHKQVLMGFFYKIMKEGHFGKIISSEERPQMIADLARYDSDLIMRKALPNPNVVDQAYNEVLPFILRLINAPANNISNQAPKASSSSNTNNAMPTSSSSTSSSSTSQPKVDPLNDRQAATNLLNQPPKDYYYHAQVADKWRKEPGMVNRDNIKHLIEACIKDVRAALLICQSRLCGVEFMDSNDAAKIIAAHRDHPTGNKIEFNFKAQRSPQQGSESQAPELSPDMRKKVQLLKELNLNPYQILGVDANSSPADIKKAFREQVVLAHPDKSKSIAGDRTKNILIAREILLDDQAKRCFEPPSSAPGPR